MAFAGADKGISFVCRDKSPRMMRSGDQDDEGRRSMQISFQRVLPRAAHVLGMAVGLFLIAAGCLRAADRDRLEAFLEVTGFGVALDSIALSAADAPAMLGLSESDFGDGWSRMATEVFDSRKMRNMGLDILSETLSDEMLEHAAAFYASDLGRRLVVVENSSHMAQDGTGKREEGEALLTAMDNSRIDSLKRMNAAVDAAGTGVRAVQEIQVRFLLAASVAGVLDYEIDEPSLRAIMAEDEAQLRESISESALVNAAYTYRDLSTEELLIYAEALEDPVMSRVYELMNAVQYEIMANRFEVLAVRMGELVQGENL